jgi:hypothetical protein
MVEKEILNFSDIKNESETITVYKIQRRPNGKWSVSFNVKLTYLLKDGRIIEFNRDVELGNAIQKGRRQRTSNKLIEQNKTNAVI